MKTLIGLLLFSLNVHAAGVIELILKDAVVLNATSKFEIDYKVDCIPPKEKQIHWMCMNGGNCAFGLDITCISQIGTFNSNDQVTRLSFFGRVTTKNSVESVQIDSNYSVIRYEPLQSILPPPGGGMSIGN